MIKIIKSSRKEQEKIDTIQPYDRKTGKPNAKFEQFYGSVKNFGENHIGEKTPTNEPRDPNYGKKKYYIP